MDRTKGLKASVVEWGEAKGRKKAVVALLRAGFSTSSAEKILRGRYPYELRADNADKLTKILIKDGFLAGGQKAS